MYYDTDLNMTVMTDIDYIKIAIANCYGKDKLEWADRLLFVETHSMEELWGMVGDADEPYQMRKALHALADVYAGKQTGYAVGLDHTCSGLQVFAALSGCYKTAKKVNLINDGIRHDLYKDTGEALQIEASRSKLKEAIMTSFYESTAIPEEVFGDELPAYHEMCAKELTGAWEILHLAIAAQACIGESYRFKNPSGHDVYIRQTIKVDYKVAARPPVDWVKSFNFTQRTTEFGLKTNAKGVPNDKSIAAALAHTCDAWVANESVRIAREEYGFDAYHVFDQLFCSPKHMNRLRWIAREQMAKLAESNWLEEAFQQITGDTTFKYTKHSDNLADEIRKADYIVC